MTQFEVIHKQTGQRVTAYVLDKLDVTLTPPTVVQVYEVGGRDYTPAEFWSQYRQVTT